MPPSFDAFADTAELLVPAAFTAERLAMYRRALSGPVRAAPRRRDSRAGQRGARARRPKPLARPSEVQRRARASRRRCCRDFVIGDYPDTTVRAAGRGYARAAHRVRQRRQSSAGAAGRAITRAGDSRRHRRRPRPHRPAGADGKPGARRHRRHRRRAARLVDVADAGGQRPDRRSPPGNRHARSHGRPCRRLAMVLVSAALVGLLPALQTVRRARAPRRARRWQRRHRRNACDHGSAKR